MGRVTDYAAARGDAELGYLTDEEKCQMNEANREIKIGDKVEASFTARVSGISEEVGTSEPEILYRLEVRSPGTGRFLGFISVPESMLVN